MNVVDLIRTKRDGGRLTDEQIAWVMDAYTRGVIAEEQMAALAMAILFRGMDAAETVHWTRSMIDSGERLRWHGLDRPTVDKHSTGGVGDKITLVLVPLVATCGAAVPHMAGRGLGYTGGTLDKLESIAGWRAALSVEEIAAQLRDVGAVICAPTDRLAPADRRLYALRDVTGTVESLPLIASSIMSKKIAAGARTLVLDVKTGSGAFMKTTAEARELAETLVAIARAHGVRVAAVLTDMTAPLGTAVGNALEVAESVQVLRGGGPADVVAVTVALAREMLVLAGIDGTDPARVLASGAAYETWCRMIRAQGGDPSAPLPAAGYRHEVPAPTAGVVRNLDARAVGVAAWRLGAGRARKEHSVHPAAGVRVLAGPGERVTAGQPVLELHTDNPRTVPGALEALGCPDAPERGDGADCAVQIGEHPAPRRQLVLDVLRATWERPGGGGQEAAAG